MLNSDWDGKKNYAQKIVEAFSRMEGYDQNSKNPQNPVNQLLVAKWSAYVITNHFETYRQNFWKSSPNRSISN
jgi:hypothetical protein